MKNSNKINQSRQSRIYNGGGTECQAKSEDRIGILLDELIDGLLDPEATPQHREQGGRALIELVRIRAARRIGHRIQQEGDDIRSDATAGVLEALEKMHGKCFAIGGPRFATRKKLKGYVLEIVDRQISSAIRNAAKRVSRQQAIAWQQSAALDENDEELVHPLDKKSTDDFRAKLKEHAPTVQEIRTAIEEAAFRGELIAAALYDLCLEVFESHEQPTPEMPKAPEGMSKRTRQRREQEGVKSLAKRLRPEPEMA